MLEVSITACVTCTMYADMGQSQSKRAVTCHSKAAGKEVAAWHGSAVTQAPCGRTEPNRLCVRHEIGQKSNKQK